MQQLSLASLPRKVKRSACCTDWCIGPADPAAMNTFVERPAIQARLLYWLTALHAVNGMLYCTPQQRYLT